MANERLTRIYLKLVIILALVVAAGVALWQGKLRLGLDLRGGTELRYRIKEEGLTREERQNVVQRTIDVIRKRVDPQGNMEMEIRPEGRYRFYIQLPGMGAEEARRIENLIRRSGKLRFRLVNDDAEARARAMQGDPIPGHVPFVVARRDAEGDPIRWRIARYDELKNLSGRDAEEWMLVQRDPPSRDMDVTGDALEEVRKTTDRTGFPAVGFRFGGLGRAKFERLTEAHQGKRLAIILDQDLYSAPRIKERISGEGIIEGRFTEQEVEDLLVILRAGRLPADIELMWNNSVGAQLGEDSIRNGIRASVIALLLVVLFMAVYYLITGVIADFAVMLNLLFVLALIVAMRSTLTLPGIAGLVLTLGMAVDANVLINERIREEREKGKTLALAVRTGYERAFVTILDSNLTTLITALILFGVGTGPVKGFALTLSLGIIVSMFTAIWVTRAIIDVLIEHGVLKNLTMLRLLSGARIPFCAWRRVAMFSSLILIAIGLSLLWRGCDRVKDTDLTGGVRVEMQLDKGIPLDEFRKRVSRIFPGKSDVQAVWEPGGERRSGYPTRFSVRVRRLDEGERVEKMRSDIAAALGVMPKLGQKTYEFLVSLAEPMTEQALRDRLQEAGYRDDSIRHILLLDEPASEFLVVLRRERLDPARADAQVGRVLDALRPVLASHEVRLHRGQISTERPEAPDESGGRGRARRFIPIQLGVPAYTVAIREAIIRQFLDNARPENAGDLVVTGHGDDQGKDPARDVAVYASDALLERIASAQRDALTVYEFTVPSQGDQVRVFTQDPVREADLRGRLSEGGVLDELVRSVIPLGAKGKEFLLAMYPLSEEKAVERITEQLRGAFSEEELRLERVHVSLEPSPSDPDVPDLDRLKAEGYRFYVLKLDRPVQWQAIRRDLLRAGYRDALLAQEVTSATASEKVDKVTLKLKGDAEAVEQARARIAHAFENPDPFLSSEAIGGVVAGELRDKALLAILLSWVAIIFYIWFRFGELKFGVAGVIALVHDVLITAGAVGVADALSGTAVGAALGFSDIKINLTMIAAFLTLIGYSINDTIVVFDRIRENMGGVRRRVDAALIDASINQVLSRTLLTSLTTLIVLVVLYIMGGAVIHGFAFVMTFGVIVGTYSSIFIASPIVLDWERMFGGARRALRAVSLRKG